MRLFETDSRISNLAIAAEASSKVVGTTHSFYRYPARFGETFVREAIAHYSKPGETVLDPFCGGGTTVVESLISGRRAIGSDLSELALFVTRLKTSPLSEHQLNVVGIWTNGLCQSVAALLHPHADSDDERLSGLPGQYRNLLANLKAHTDALPRGETRAFGQGLLLKVAQWAFDGKEHVPTPSEIVQRLPLALQEMASGMRAFARAHEASGCTKRDIFANRQLVLVSADKLATHFKSRPGEKVSLVVTSPPYLGVHVLYNKWQLGGRRELRAPFFLANCKDLGGPSAYTIIDRHSKSHEKYYAAIRSSFESVRSLMHPRGYVIQLVSFANSTEALPRYLATLQQAGFELCESYANAGTELQWREVPGRRWYSRVGAVTDSSASKEVLLIHRNRREA